MALAALIIAVLALLVGTAALALAWIFSAPVDPDPFDDEEV